jgi:hypothetical protein
MAGLGAPRARTVAGTVDSLLDLRRTVLTVALDFGTIPYGARFGGLRGGAVRVTKAGALLEHFSYVPGLQLTGLVPFGILLRNAGAPASLTVGGPAGPSGRLRIGSAGRLSGVLAGRSFHVRAAAKVRLASAGQAGESPPPSFPAPPLARVR